MQARMAVRRATAAVTTSSTRLDISAAYTCVGTGFRCRQRHRNMFVDFRSAVLLLTYVHSVTTREATRGPCLESESSGGVRGIHVRRRGAAGSFLSSGVQRTSLCP